MELVNWWLGKNKADRRKILVEFVNSNLSEESVDFIRLIEAPANWGVFASDGPHFKFAVFGRDSLLVAEDLIKLRPELVKHIILRLASLQGIKTDLVSEEEPGKIHHEYRRNEFGDYVVPEHSLNILHSLQDRWGGKGTDQMIYYGSFDSTPLYIRLIGLYVDQYGKDILSEKYVRVDGQTNQVGDSIKAAIDWLCTKLEKSRLGLLEYKRLNPLGLINQSWKDSETACLNADGSFPNFDDGVAVIELQGYAYDALTQAKKLFPDKKAEVEKWDRIATKIQENTIKHMWMQRHRFFAQGLYYSKDGKPKQIDTLTSNGGLILDSSLLQNLPAGLKNHYVYNIASLICSDSFLTNAGVRSRAIQHISIPSFIDYHGSYTVWPKETNDISRGLRKYGFNMLAKQLEDRLLASILDAGEFYEFFYVDKDGTVWYDQALAMAHFDLESPDGNLPIPENSQAWTISAVYRILSLGIRNKAIGASNIEKSILADVPGISVPESLVTLNEQLTKTKEA